MLAFKGELLSIIENIAPYLAVITAIIAAYYAYRNQLRLKSFELLHERRQEVLRDMEGFLKFLYEVASEKNKNKSSEITEKYKNEYFHQGLILFHKVKGANFGELSENLAQTFFSIIQEPSLKEGVFSEEEFYSWIYRTRNTVSAMYGFSHSIISQELEAMAFTPLQRFMKKRKHKVKAKVEES